MLCISLVIILLQFVLDCFVCMWECSLCECARCAHACASVCVRVCVCAVMMYQIFTHNIDLPARTDCIFIKKLFLCICVCVI